jgi:hypothetical protein
MGHVNSICIVALFHRARKGKGRGTRKGKKKSASADNTSVTDANATVPDGPLSDITGEVDISLYRGYFRELDIEVFVALSKTLVMDKKHVKVMY